MNCSAVTFYLTFKTGRTLLSIYRDNKYIDYLRKIVCGLKDHGSFPVFVLSKTYVCCPSIAGIAGSNHAGGMDILPSSLMCVV
jgi:hypothetical protein